MSECDGIFATIHHPGTYAKLREMTKRPIVCTTELDDPRASYADVAGVSQPTLQGTIRKTFGMSANKYILSVKMREAKRLMDLGGSGAGGENERDYAENCFVGTRPTFCPERANQPSPV